MLITRTLDEVTISVITLQKLVPMVYYNSQAVLLELIDFYSGDLANAERLLNFIKNACWIDAEGNLKNKILSGGIFMNGSGGKSLNKDGEVLITFYKVNTFRSLQEKDNASY